MRAVLSALLVAFLRFVTRVFFRTVEVAGLHNVPKEGPVMFVGNHGNSLLDPVMITTTCRRRVRFAAKETLFSLLPLRPILWVLGSVPIRRRQDQGAATTRAEGDEAAAPSSVDNSAAFDALFAVLHEGDAFGIFPEGISHDRPELAPLKTGAARIALEAAARGIAVRIVPCGLTFLRKGRMRSRVLVQYGPPITIDAGWQQQHLDDPVRAVKVFTRHIELALRSQTINAPDFETLRVLHGVRRLYLPEKKALSLSDEHEILRRFLGHWDRLRTQPDVNRFFHDVDSFLFELRALRVNDEDLTVPRSMLWRATALLRHLVFFALFVPLALPGLVLHAPILFTAVLAGSTLTARDDVRATIKMVSASLLTLSAWLAIAGAIWAANPGPAGALWAVGVILGLALSGYATIRVLERQRHLRRGLSTLVALLHLDTEIERLVALREGLRGRLLDLVDRYADAGLDRIVTRADHDDLVWLDDDDAIAAG